jgi:hypothetical protein
MKKAALPLLLPLVACSTSRATEKPQGPEALVQVGPLVKSVVGNSRTLEPEGDFFRAVTANSEYDPCLRVERVNVRAPAVPQVKETRKYCAVTLGAEELALSPEGAQDVTISSLSWQGFELRFALSYTAASRGASEQELRCTLDPRQAQNKVPCTPASGTDAGE